MMRARSVDQARGLIRRLAGLSGRFGRDALERPPLLLALSAGLLFLLGLLASGPPAARTQTAAADNFAPLVFAPADPQAARAILAERPLWGSITAPTAPEAAAAPVQQAVAWRLAGVVKEKGRFVVVITEGTPPKARRLEPGAKLPDDSVIVAAAPTAVTVAKNGTETVLRLFKGKN